MSILYKIRGNVETAWSTQNAHFVQICAIFIERVVQFSFITIQRVYGRTGKQPQEVRP